MTKNEMRDEIARLEQSAAEQIAEARWVACLLAGDLCENERYAVLEPLQARHEWLRPEWEKTT